MHHFFVPEHQIYEHAAEEKLGEILITGEDAHHIGKVLRMKVGEQLLVGDGAGHDYLCEIHSFEESGEEVHLAILEKSQSRQEPSVSFYLFQGLPKSDKLEHIIQKSVELGVFEIIPFSAARSIVQYDAKKVQAKQTRWQKIAESAAKQSKRGIIPEVKTVMHYEAALQYAAKTCDLILFAYENNTDIQKTKKLIADIKPGMKVAIFIGPEGGFEESEVQRACTPKPEGAGAEEISLGSRILRTETAPLMLLSVLVFALEE